MIVDELVARDDYWLPLWLLEGKSGKRWCISLCFMAWQLQLASLMGCDFMRFRFKPDSSNDDEEEDEYYLSVGFFRRATSDSMTDFDGPSCMIYKDLERSVYQNEGTTNCAIVSLGFSSIALLYFILAMFGVARHKNRESYGLAGVTIIAGLMMAWPQNFVASERCDVDHYTNSVIGANPNFPQFKYFTECNYGVQGVCGLIACLMWISAGLLLLCNAHYTKTPMQLAKAEELRKREHLRLEYFDQDTYQNHKALAKEQEELNQKTLKAVRIMTMSTNREYEATQKYQETKSKEKQESAQPDRGQDIVSNIEEPKMVTVRITAEGPIRDEKEEERVPVPFNDEETGLVKSDVLQSTMEKSDDEEKDRGQDIVSNIEVPEGTDAKMVSVFITAGPISDLEEEERVPVDDEETGVVKSDVSQSTMEKSDDEEKAGVVKSVAFQSTIEKYDDEEKAGVVNSDVFQSPIENFDDEDYESDAILSKSIGDNKKDGSKLTPQSPDQNFFDADDISFEGSQDQSILTGVSYGDTINAAPAKQVPKNVRTFVDQSSTITMDKEIE